MDIVHLLGQPGLDSFRPELENHKLRVVSRGRKSNRHPVPEQRILRQAIMLGLLDEQFAADVVNEAVVKGRARDGRVDDVLVWTVDYRV